MSLLCGAKCALHVCVPFDGTVEMKKSFIQKVLGTSVGNTFATAVHIFLLNYFNERNITSFNFCMDHEVIQAFLNDLREARNRGYIHSSSEWGNLDTLESLLEKVISLQKCEDKKITALYVVEQIGEGHIIPKYIVEFWGVLDVDMPDVTVLKQTYQ